MLGCTIYTSDFAPFPTMERCELEQNRISTSLYDMYANQGLAVALDEKCLNKKEYDEHMKDLVPIEQEEKEEEKDAYMGKPII